MLLKARVDLALFAGKLNVRFLLFRTLELEETLEAAAAAAAADDDRFEEGASPSAAAAPAPPTERESEGFF